MPSLAAAIEAAMNGESANFGHNIQYDVSWDAENKKMAIKEAGTALDELTLLWESGKNTLSSAAGVLGFDRLDDSAIAGHSQQEAEWGIFNTLFDLRQYLDNNDVNGLDRSMTRLDKHFKYLSTLIADTGIKANRIEVKQKINMDLNLSLTERGSKIEDADMIKAVMELQSNQLAYEAALKSSTMLLQLSLVDYL
jgi:flagellar hook-associated protein 3 FlgL